MGDRKQSFQRARNDEQKEERRTVILNAARELLEATPVRDVSLRELSRNVGLSKTNVVRYFETREAVFFELLNQSLEDWLNELPAEMSSVVRKGPNKVKAVADALARSLGQRTIICKLWSALGDELESNISEDTVREFKLVHGTRQGRLGQIVRDCLPELTADQGREFVSLIVVIVAGLWPFANPSPAVQAAQRHPSLAGSRVDFSDRLGRYLFVALSGILSTRPS